MEKEEEVWKRSSLCKSHMVSSLGRVKDPDGKIVKPFLSKKGYYRYIIEKKFLNGKRFVSGHRIIITEFSPKPNDKAQINHIDGNKLNNRADNLEWLSGSENVKHSLINDLRSDNIKIKVTDLVKREIYTYVSINDFFLNMQSDNTNTPGMIIPIHTILAYVYRTKFKPYINRYIIELEGDVELSDKYNSVTIFGYNHFTKKWNEYKSYNHMSLNTGIKSATVLDYLQNKKSVYYAGYTFSKTKDVELEEIDVEKAKDDYNRNLSLEIKLKHKAFLIYDYDKNEELKFENIKDVSKLLKCSKDQISIGLYRSIMKNKSWVVNGYGIKPYGTVMKWEMYNKEVLLNSKYLINWTRPIYRVIETGELIFGNKNLCEKFGLSLSQILNTCDNKEKFKRCLERANLTVSVSRLKHE